MHDQPAHFTFQVGKHPLVVPDGGFARLDHDLFRGGDGFLRFLLAHARGGGPRLLDQFVRLVIGPVKNGLTGGLGFRQLRLDFLRVLQPFRNALTAFFEHGQDWPVGKPVKQAGYNQETDDLGKEMGRVQPKFLRRVMGGPGQVAADVGQQNKLVHKSVRLMCGAEPNPAPRRFLSEQGRWRRTQWLRTGPCRARPAQ